MVKTVLRAVLLAGLVGVLFFLWFSIRTLNRPSAVVLPAAEEIDTLTAEIYDNQEKHGIPPIPEFAVPEAYVPSILEAFRPAETYDYGAFYEKDFTIGQLTLTTKGGQIMKIKFCDGGKCPITFSVDGVRCVRRGAYKPIFIGKEFESYAGESLLLYSLLMSIHDEMVKGDGHSKVQRYLEDMQRSHGDRPPQRR
jgi:hypothetical protein